MWIKDNITRTGKEVFYESKLIDEIKELIKPVIIMNTCDNCDGVGYGDGCQDISCGTYAAYEIYKQIKSYEGKR